jgi:pilus assembly protein CpaB
MGRARIFVVLAIAAIGAIGIALIVGMMTKHRPAPPVVAAAQPAQPMARVLVARHDLAVGARLTPNDVTWQDWPASAVNPAFITDGRGARVVGTATTAALADQASQTMHAAATVVTGGPNPVDQLSGSIVREVILTNEPITNAKLVRGGQGGFMSVVLHPGMRAMSVPVTAVDSAGGFVLPGDRVDVLMGHGAAPATLVLRNLQVLAVDQNSQQPKAGQQSQVGATATLEVAANDSEILVRAMATARTQQSDIILALRPYSDANQPSGAPDGGQNTGQVRILRTGQGAETVTLQ